MEANTPIDNLPHQAVTNPPLHSKNKTITLLFFSLVVVTATLAIGLLTLRSLPTQTGETDTGKDTVTDENAAGSDSFFNLLKERMATAANVERGETLTPNPITPVPTAAPVKEEEFYLQIGKNLRGVMPR